MTSLASVISSRTGSLRAFRAGLQREEERWRDERLARIRHAHLDRLIAENERFDRELAEIETAVRAAKRRLR